MFLNCFKHHWLSVFFTCVLLSKTAYSRLSCSSDDFKTVRLLAREETTVGTVGFDILAWVPSLSSLAPSCLRDAVSS